MKVQALIASGIAALALAGTAGAQVLDRDVKEGSGVQTITLGATDRTTAFTVGAWSAFQDANHPATVVVDYTVDCASPVNDKAGQVVLTGLRADAYLWTGNRNVGGGWDSCAISVKATADFGAFGSGFQSAFSVWLNSHNGR